MGKLSQHDLDEDYALSGSHGPRKFTGLDSCRRKLKLKSELKLKSVLLRSGLEKKMGGLSFIVNFFAYDEINSFTIITLTIV